MTKKTLEEKIRQVGCWTFGFIFWYLVIAFFLKSNYPIYESNLDRGAAYDVIKDALTLAAAFLAPIVAFVLFSDWRSEHKEVGNEKNSQEINRLLWAAYISVSNLIDINTNEKIATKQIIFYENSINAKQLLENIYVFDEESEQYKANITELIKLLEETSLKWSSLAYLGIASATYGKPEDDQSQKVQKEYSKLNSKTLSKMNSLKYLRV